MPHPHQTFIRPQQMSAHRRSALEFLAVLGEPNSDQNVCIITRQVYLKSKMQLHSVRSDAGQRSQSVKLLIEHAQLMLM